MNFSIDSKNRLPFAEFSLLNQIDPLKLSHTYQFYHSSFLNFVSFHYDIFQEKLEMIPNREILLT
jgi:hypothetical protein